MTFSFKEELSNADPKEFLPQNLTPKMLAYIGIRVDDFIEQYASRESAPDKENKKIKFDPDILDIVTKIYVSQNGDHEIDLSDINNIIAYQENMAGGATYYCLAVHREALGRDSGIPYEKPTLENILTKAPDSYDCNEMIEKAKKKNCSGCSGCSV